LEEGQTISKAIVPQVDPEIALQVQKLGRIIGYSVAGFILVGLMLSMCLNLDSLPFWLFFNIWQMFSHIPLLNIKIPGFVSEYWREQLRIWTLRNYGVTKIMSRLTADSIETQKSYTLQLESASFESIHVFVNLGWILWVPIIIVGLMPFAWAVDTMCSYSDSRK
jgi:hypothetical protein